MSYILNIETSTTNCSVSLSLNGKLLHFIEVNDGYKHAENLHPFIEKLLIESSLTPRDLNAIAVSKGPGSYTGLRIGVSAAKGLAYALSIPLIGISSLKILTKAAIELKQNEKAYFVPMIDARRMEVYSACYDEKLNVIRDTEALILTENNPYINYKGGIYCFGDGAHKIISAWSISTIQIIENIYPNAKYMPELSHELFQSNSFENVAYFEPFYLKEFAGNKK